MATTLIIGGTAAYHLDFGQHARVEGERMIRTPFGEAGPVLFFQVAGQECAFISRHGGRGRLGLTPPFINYHANLWVAREIGARRVLSWNSAGSLVRSLEPGSIAAVADLIDWTRRRRTTFGAALAEAEAPHGDADNAGGPGAGGRHRTPDGPLFDPELRQSLVAAGRSLGHHVAPGAVYAATEGARLETAAEIALLAAAGAELVGMTMSPEVFLARELGLAFASICWVSNFATGVPYDGPERRLFGPEVGPKLFGIILALLEREGAAEKEASAGGA